MPHAVVGQSQSYQRLSWHTTYRAHSIISKTLQRALHQYRKPFSILPHTTSLSPRKHPCSKQS